MYDFFWTFGIGKIVSFSPDLIWFGAGLYIDVQTNLQISRILSAKSLENELQVPVGRSSDAI